MEEYLKTLLEQIRYKKAHSMIENEIRSHIEDQYEFNRLSGMSENDAMKEAIRDMGNPVETGIALDKIHRPAMAWDIILLMAAIGCAGVVIHLLIGGVTQESTQFILFTVVGFLIMLGIYRLDYSFFASFAKPIAFALFLVLFFAQKSNLGLTMNGATLWINLPFFSISIYALMMLYIPLYGAILYQYYGTDRSGILKSILWMVIPLFLVFTLPNLSLTLILFFGMAISLSLAVCKGWFHISSKKFLIIFWGIILAFPPLMLVVAFYTNKLAVYQKERIYAIINGSYKDTYISNLLRNYLSKSQWIGGSPQTVIENLPDFDNSFILTYLASGYGVLIALLACTLLALLTLKILSISFNQKNQLGMMMGFGCGLVFMINILLNILQNIGILPVTSQSFLPFFSTGGSCIITSYALIGIVLSIYRYKNLLPAFPTQKRITLSIKLNS